MLFARSGFATRSTGAHLARTSSARSAPPCSLCSATLRLAYRSLSRLNLFVRVISQKALYLLRNAQLICRTSATSKSRFGISQKQLFAEISLGRSLTPHRFTLAPLLRSFVLLGSCFALRAIGGALCSAQPRFFFFLLRRYRYYNTS